MDEATARSSLDGIQKMAEEVLAASYVDGDRIPLKLESGNVYLPEAMFEIHAEMVRRRVASL